MVFSSVRLPSLAYGRWNAFIRTFSSGAPINAERAVQQAGCIVKLRESLKLDEQNNYVVPIFKKALLHSDHTAIKDATGEFTYLQLYASAKKLSIQISNLVGSASSSHVAYLCPNTVLSPLAQWACWMSGQVAVPLHPSYPLPTLKYLTQDAQVRLIVSTPEYESTAQTLASQLDVALIIIDHAFLAQESVVNATVNQNLMLTTNNVILVEGALSNDFYTNANAMMLYTSGTTGKPKGVVLTHKNLDAQVRCLTDAWQCNAADSLLHVLPLNHVHGCVNALMCPLSVGARVVMHEQFNSHNVWSTMLGINAPVKERVNVFMAVPTIYNLLIAEYEKIFAQNGRMVEYIENHCRKNFRLMVSGSAPLPVTVFNRWREITGHTLLERYGMTEIGMALSNPYFETGPSRKRTPGTVGMPLPGVRVRLVDADSKVLVNFEGVSNEGFWAKPDTADENVTASDAAAQPHEETAPPTVVGDLQVAGPNVFKEYYERPEDTAASFTEDGFFKTGDVAAYENSVFKLLGRSSVDIIKTGGHKVSSLEIESLLLTHPSIKDVAVLGVPDDVWGERIGVLCALKPNAKLDLVSLKLFCSETLPTHKLPRVLKIVDEMPRNNMSKINKRELLKMYFSDEKEA